MCIKFDTILILGLKMRRSYQYFLRSAYNDLGVTVPPARLMDTPAPPCWALPSVATWFMPAPSTFTNSGMSAMPEPNASHDPDPTHEVVCTYVFQKEQKAGQQESFLLEFMLILFTQNVDQIYH